MRPQDQWIGSDAYHDHVFRSGHATQDLPSGTWSCADGFECEGELIDCGWFALCENVATGTLAHPILGDVPICDRCRALDALNALEGSLER